MRESHAPRSVEEQLLAAPRRTAGIDSHGQPVRLGEYDSTGHLVGYIDDDGLAWESLRERILAVCGHGLEDALALPDNDLRCDQAMDEVLELPDELIAQVAAEAALRLQLPRKPPDPDQV